jgi:uncharacterized membrane protein YeaQ/YmgE (transglycosylase-associated protein family)
MQLFFWAVFGAVAGWCTGKIMLSQGRGQSMSVLVGIAAGIGGGFLFDATPFHLEGKMIYASLAAVMSSVVFSILYQYVVVRHEFGAS